MDTLYQDMLEACKEMEMDRVDSILKDDKFFDENDIYDFLCGLTPEQAEFIYENRSSYSTRIRDIIAPKLRVQGRMRVADLPDEEMDRMEKGQEDKNEKQFEEEWEHYQLACHIERPIGELDDQLDEAWDNLMDAKKRMDTYLQRKNAVYIPPNQRSKVSPKQQEIEDEIQALENEYSRIERLVEAADIQYLERRKNDFKLSWLRKLQA